MTNKNNENGALSYTAPKTIVVTIDKNEILCTSSVVPGEDGYGTGNGYGGFSN